MAQNLRSLSADAFLDISKRTFNRTIATLEIVRCHADILLALAEDAQRPSKTQIDPTAPSSVEKAADDSSSLPSALSADLTDIVQASAELANTRYAKVIGVRSEIHTNLPLPDFVAIFQENWAFVVKCEVICQKMIVGLRGVIVSQAKSFLQAFHQARLSQSAKLVEEEQWSPADVPKAAQNAIACILDSAVQNPATLLLPSTSSKSASKTNGVFSKSTTAKHVEIEGRQYFAVNAVLRCLDSILDYLRVIINIPLLNTDAMSRIIEFLKVCTHLSPCLCEVLTNEPCSNSTLGRARSYSVLAPCGPQA